MTDLTNELASLVAEEGRKKTTAELSLLFDEEIDRLFLEDSLIKIQDRKIHMRGFAKDLGLRMSEQEIKRKIWDGRKRSVGAPVMLTPDMAIDAPDEVWACEGIVMKADTTLLVALPKVGKTTLMIDLIAKWHFGCEEYLGQKLIGKCPPVYIIGTDMPRSKWLPLLGRFGLASKKDGRWYLLKNGPIKGMFTQNEPIHFDDEGISVIGDLAAKDKGCLLVCDSYHKLIKPFGLSEADANFDGPLCDLQEVIAPHETTAVVIHHSGHSRKGEGAVAASRGSTALPAAVSQVINMKWLRKNEDINDKRVVLETEGRGEELTIIISQENERWSLEGEASEVFAEQRLIDAEEELNDFQDEVLTIVRHRSKNELNTTAKDIENNIETSHRQAGKTLRQLEKKGLIIQTAGGGKGQGEVQFNVKGPKGLKGHTETKDPVIDVEVVDVKQKVLTLDRSLGSMESFPNVKDIKDPITAKDGKDSKTVKDQKDGKDLKDSKDRKTAKDTPTKPSNKTPKSPTCKNGTTKKCDSCGKPFLAKSSVARFCGNTCRGRFHSQKKRENNVTK